MALSSRARVPLAQIEKAGVKLGLVSPGLLELEQAASLSDLAHLDRLVREIPILKRFKWWTDAMTPSCRFV